MWFPARACGHSHVAMRQRLLFLGKPGVVAAILVLTCSLFDGLFGPVLASRAQSETSARQSTATASSAAPQSPGKEPKGDAVSDGVAVGTGICATLTKTIDAKKAKAGDAISARTTMAVLSHGRTLIPVDARLSGHITAVSRRSRSNPESKLGIIFDRVTLKDGSAMTLPLTVQAIGRGNLPHATPADTGDSDADDSIASSALGPPHGTPPRHSSIPRPQYTPHPQPKQDTDTKAAGDAHAGPVLDVTSKGVVGLPGVRLA